MFLLSRPDEKAIREFLLVAVGDHFSYAEVGATNFTEPPPGYNVDHNRELLGNGQDVFELAKQAIRGWKMFKMQWVGLWYPDTPIETGRTVAIVIRHFGFCSLNGCRIVYSIDEPKRFGFAYGTLTEHGEIGEERFSVEMLPNGEVWYDLYAFSRPASFLARLGYPLARRLQKRFAQDSKAAMLEASKGLR